MAVSPTAKAGHCETLALSSACGHIVSLFGPWQRAWI